MSRGHLDVVAVVMRESVGRWHLLRGLLQLLLLRRQRWTRVHRRRWICGGDWRAAAPASAAVDGGASAAMDCSGELLLLLLLQLALGAQRVRKSPPPGQSSRQQPSKGRKKKCLLRASPAVPLKFLPYISKQGTPLKRFSPKNCSTPAVPINISLILYFKNIS